MHALKQGQDGANGSGLLEALPQPTRLAMVEGESLTNVVSPISYALARRRGGGGEFDGALHITNFRLALERTGPGKVGNGMECMFVRVCSTGGYRSWCVGV